MVAPYLLTILWIIIVLKNISKFADDFSTTLAVIWMDLVCLKMPFSFMVDYYSYEIAAKFLLLFLSILLLFFCYLKGKLKGVSIFNWILYAIITCFAVGFYFSKLAEIKNRVELVYNILSLATILFIEVLMVFNVLKAYKQSILKILLTSFLMCLTFLIPNIKNVNLVFLLIAFAMYFGLLMLGKVIKRSVFSMVFFFCVTGLNLFYALNIQ